MNSTIPDLWPSNLIPVQTELSPVKILRQQAHALGQKTRNFVVGKVRSQSDDEYFHWFTIIAPLLDLEQDVLLISHSKSQLYPAKIMHLENEKRTSAGKAEDADEFMSLLRAIFAEKRMTDLIGSLLSQCDVEDDD